MQNVKDVAYTVSRLLQKIDVRYPNKDVMTSGRCTSGCTNKNNWFWDLPGGPQPLTYHSWAPGSPTRDIEDVLELYDQDKHWIYC